MKTERKQAKHRNRYIEACGTYLRVTEKGVGAYAELQLPWMLVFLRFSVNCAITFFSFAEGERRERDRELERERQREGERQ